MPPTPVIDFFFNSNNWFVIYWASCGLYLNHFFLARHYWPSFNGSANGRHVHILTRTSVAWMLTGDGYFGLTNAKALMHVIIAFVPLLNTVAVLVECVYGTMFEIKRLLDKTPLSSWLKQDARPRRRL